LSHGSLPSRLVSSSPVKGVHVSRTMIAIYALILWAGLAPHASADTFQPAADIRLEPVASGLSSPLYLTAPAADPRLFIVEQPGRIRIVRNGELLPTPFLDITDRLSSGGERGLLSVA